MSQKLMRQKTRNRDTIYGKYILTDHAAELTL